MCVCPFQQRVRPIIIRFQAMHTDLSVGHLVPSTHLRYGQVSEPVIFVFYDKKQTPKRNHFRVHPAKGLSLNKPASDILILFAVLLFCSFCFLRLF